MKYLRHRVLFNLYNFDLDQSRFKAECTSADPTVCASEEFTIPLVDLTLINCEFKYFLDDYEALIYVETSIVERVDNLFSRPYIVQLGDDRGARITITNSVFKHSSFCKGLIVYRPQPELLPYDNNYLVLNFAYEAEHGVRDWTKRGDTQLGYGSTPPKIEITDSVFWNLNHGRNITHLSVVEESYQSTYISTMPTTNGKLIPYFDNHGAVLNVESFPGEIVFKNNQVKNNMYFVRDVYPSYRKESDIEPLLDSFIKDDQVQML